MKTNISGNMATIGIIGRTTSTSIDELYQFTTYNNITFEQSNLIYLKLSEIIPTPHQISLIKWAGILNPKDYDFAIVYKLSDDSNYLLRTFRSNYEGNKIFLG